MLEGVPFAKCDQQNATGQWSKQQAAASSLSDEAAAFNR